LLKLRKAFQRPFFSPLLFVFFNQPKRRKKKSMGQPLFSQSYLSAPAVRTEPEPSIPPYEKWSYWNPFDPDSDEFVENDPVYEAFIVLPPSPEPDPDDQRDVVFVPDSESSSSSDSSPNERRSPMAVGTDDPAQMFADALINTDLWGQRPALSPPSNVLYTPGFVPQDTQTRVFARGNRPRSATITVLPLSTSPPRDNLHRVSNRASNAANTSASQGTPVRPSTPPNQMMTPSPVPSASPHILTWPSFASPSPAGPLTNPNARMSLAHIPPTFFGVRDVVI
jgi:hypothetical protein